jgi:hypothetical protein
MREKTACHAKYLIRQANFPLRRLEFLPRATVFVATFLNFSTLYEQFSVAFPRKTGAHVEKSDSPARNSCRPGMIPRRIEPFFRRSEIFPVRPG